jgi:hypothetical protein
MRANEMRSDAIDTVEGATRLELYPAKKPHRSPL